MKKMGSKESMGRTDGKNRRTSSTREASASEAEGKPDGVGSNNDSRLCVDTCCCIFIGGTTSTDLHHFHAKLSKLSCSWYLQTPPNQSSIVSYSFCHLQQLQSELKHNHKGRSCKYC